MVREERAYSLRYRSNMEISEGKAQFGVDDPILFLLFTQQPGQVYCQFYELQVGVEPHANLI